MGEHEKAEQKWDELKQGFVSEANAFKERLQNASADVILLPFCRQLEFVVQ